MGSIAREDLSLDEAALRAPCIVVGTVLELSTVPFPDSPGSTGGLRCLRIRPLRTLKGPPFSPAAELRVFCSAEWFRHTHAEVIADGVISYADSRYSGGLALDQIRPGLELLVFLSAAEPAPEGFPAGTVFMPFAGAHDRAEREKEVLAALLRKRPLADGQVVRLVVKEGVVLPDGLELTMLGHSHKRPQTGGPTREWITLDLVRDGRTEQLDLGHDGSPDGTETWESKRWGPYEISVTAMSTTDATLVVRKSAPAP